MTWGFIWLMLVLKLPIAALLYIVWWAVHQDTEPDVGPSDGDGGTKTLPARRPAPAASASPTPPRPPRLSEPTRTTALTHPHDRGALAPRPARLNDYAGWSARLAASCSASMRLTSRTAPLSADVAIAA